MIMRVQTGKQAFFSVLAHFGIQMQLGVGTSRITSKKCLNWTTPNSSEPGRSRAAALALGQDFDRETVDAAGADRARVVFPIILVPWHKFSVACLMTRYDRGDHIIRKSTFQCQVSSETMQTWKIWYCRKPNMWSFARKTVQFHLWRAPH